MSKTLFLPSANGKFSQQGEPQFSVKIADSGKINLVVDGPRDTVCAMICDSTQNEDAAGVLFTAIYARLQQLGIKSMAEFHALTYFARRDS